MWVRNNLKCTAEAGWRQVLLLCFVLGVAACGWAEDLPNERSVPPSADSSTVDSTVVIDTVLFRQTGLLAGYLPVTDTTNLERRLIQNPTVALFKSALIPGWGQWGNHEYIKAVIFFGLDAWCVGAAIHYGRQASDFREKYESSTIISQRNDYYDLYSDRKDERNKFTWFAVIVTFVSMFDAYVDAHLSGFPRLEGEHLRLQSYTGTRNDFGVRLSVAF